MTGMRRLPVGPVLLAVIVLAAIVGPWLTNFDPVAVDTSVRLRAPFTTYPDGGVAVFGTDQLGRDMLDQVVVGAGISLLIGACAAALAGIVGALVGVAAGWLGGRGETVIMRIVDVQLSFPSILIAVFLAAFVPPSIFSVIVVLAVTRWAQVARLTRAVTVRVWRQGYVESALVSGFSTWRILVSCVVPNLIPPLLVLLTAELSLIILAESALGFLGLGTPPNTPSWGRIIANGRNYLDQAWWISTLPGLVIAIVVIAIGLTGDWLRRRFSHAGWALL